MSKVKMTSSNGKFKNALRGVLEEHVVEWKVTDFQLMMSQPSSESRSPFTSSAVKDDCFFYFKLQPVPGGEKIGLFTLYFLTRCYRDVELEVNCDCEVLTIRQCVVVSSLQISGKSPQRPISCNFRIDYRVEDSLARQILEDDCLIVQARFSVWHGTPYGVGGPSSNCGKRVWHGGVAQTDLHRSSSVKLPLRTGARPASFYRQDESLGHSRLAPPISKRPVSLNLPSLTSDIVPPRDIAFSENLQTPVEPASHSVLSDLLGVKLNSVKPIISGLLLTYLATGDVPNIDDYAEELLQVSHKYGMSDLKRKCCVSLWKNITEESAVDTYFIAEEYKVSQLKKRVLNYIAVDPEKRLGSHMNDFSLPPDLEKIRNKADGKQESNW